MVFLGLIWIKPLALTIGSFSFPTLDSYKLKWINDSNEFALNNFSCNPNQVFYETTRLENFDFHGDTVLVHKVFNGSLSLEEEKFIELKWRSLFLLRLVENRWKIGGFCGYIFKNNER